LLNYLLKQLVGQLLKLQPTVVAYSKSSNIISIGVATVSSIYNKVHLCYSSGQLIESVYRQCIYWRIFSISI